MIARGKMCKSAAKLRDTYNCKPIATGQVIRMQDLVTGLGQPNFPEIPGEDEATPYVSDAERWAGQINSEVNIPQELA